MTVIVDLIPMQMSEVNQMMHGKSKIALAYCISGVWLIVFSAILLLLQRVRNGSYYILEDESWIPSGRLI